MRDPFAIFLFIVMGIGLSALAWVSFNPPPAVPAPEPARPVEPEKPRKPLCPKDRKCPGDDEK